MFQGLDGLAGDRQRRNKKGRGGAKMARNVDRRRINSDDLTLGGANPESDQSSEE